MGKLFTFVTPKSETMKNVFLFALVVLVLASGCRDFGRSEKGSGNVVSDTRSITGFNSIDVSGAIDVFIRQDSSTSVKVEADDNLLQYVEVYTDNSTLVIKTRRGIWIRPTHKIKVYVSNPIYTDFEVSGASNIRSETEISSNETLRVGLSGASNAKLDFNAPRISVDLTGASNLTIRGKTRDFEAGASGASEIRCFELLTENTEVEASGASSAEVYASVKIAGSASGASHIRYKGNAIPSISSSGASGVNKIE